MSKSSQSRGWKLGARWAAVLVGAAVLGGAPWPAPAEAQRRAIPQALELAEAGRLGAEAEKLREEGKYDAALPLVERALTLREKALGPDHPLVATSLNNLAVLYVAKGDYARAEPLHQRALAIREKALGPDHLDVASSLHDLAVLYDNKGDYARAEPSRSAPLAIREKALGPHHPAVAESLNSLAVLYDNKGDYARAEPLAQRALAIREKALGPHHPAVASSLDDLAVLYWDKGDYARAEPLNQRALAIREKALGPDHPDVAESLNNLAVVCWDKGDYARAELLYQRALTIREKALGPDHPDVAESLNDLAILYWDKGDYARAKPLYQRSLAIFEKALGPDHPLVAISLNNLARLYLDKGDHARAKPLYQRSLAIREKALGPDHPDIATSLNNLARLYQDKGDYAAAEPLYQRSLAIREKALGPDRPRVATSLHNLARLYRDKGDYTHAEPLFQRALAIWEKALGPDHPDVAEVLYNLATLEEAREDYPRAIALSQRAAEIREKHLALYLTADAQVQKRAYLANVARDMDHDSSLALHTGDREATELALTTLLRRKGRALDATADSMRVLRARLGPDEQKLFDDLLAVRSVRSTLILRGPAPMPLDAYRTRLAELEAQDQQIESAISARSATFRAREQPITVASVKAALPEGASLVEWSVYRPFHPRAGTPQDQWGPPRYVACVLPQKGAPACVDLGEAKPIEAAVTRLRRALSRAAGQNVQKLARDLDAQVMAPVRKLLGNTRWVFLSPDGALNLVPFAALVDEGGRYLVESYAFTYLTSGRDLLRLREETPAPRATATVVAAPDFDAGDPAAPAADDKAEAERGVQSRDFSGVSFSALPGTETEARAVAGEARPSRLLLGEAATEQALKALRGPSVLHIATHGFFLPDKPELRAAPRAGGSLPPLTGEDPLLRSGLALAGANQRKSGSDDGVLTALELTGQDLYGTKLVVLSACETGLGEVTHGDGVYGLRRALVLAGSRTQVMSLWKVDDRSTQALMTAYYRRLGQGGGRSEAMRQVQLAMLAEGERVRPYYWASFIVSGDWTSLDGKPAVPELGRVHPGPRGCACAIDAPPPLRAQGWTVLAALGLGLARRRARRG